MQAAVTSGAELDLQVVSLPPLLSAPPHLFHMTAVSECASACARARALSTTFYSIRSFWQAVAESSALDLALLSECDVQPRAPSAPLRRRTAAPPAPSLRARAQDDQAGGCAPTAREGRHGGWQALVGTFSSHFSRLALELIVNPRASPAASRRRGAAGVRRARRGAGGPHGSGATLPLARRPLRPQRYRSRPARSASPRRPQQGRLQPLEARAEAQERDARCVCSRAHATVCGTAVMRRDC